MARTHAIAWRTDDRPDVTDRQRLLESWQLAVRRIEREVLRYCMSGLRASNVLHIEIHAIGADNLGHTRFL